MKVRIRSSFSMSTIYKNLGLRKNFKFHDPVNACRRRDFCIQVAEKQFGGNKGKLQRWL